MANEENLAPPFPKGVSGNPAGKPKGTRNRSTIVREAIEAVLAGSHQTVVDAMTAAIIAKAMNGDVPAYKELLDSAFGKVADKMEAEVKQEVKSDLTSKLLAALPKEQLEAILAGKSEDNG